MFTLTLIKELADDGELHEGGVHHVQFCWAHLIREILFVSEKSDKSASNYGNRLLHYVRAMFETIHQRAHLSKSYWRRLMKEHRRRFLKTVRRSVPKDKDCQNIAKRFIDFAKEYFYDDFQIVKNFSDS